MKKLVVLLLWSCMADLLAADLVQIYEMALESDPQLAAAKSTRDSTGEARPLALAPLLPQLSLSGAATRIDYDPHNETFFRGKDTYSTNDTTLTLKQALVRFDRWIQLDQSNYTIEASKAQYESAYLNLMLRVAQAYFNILAAEDNLELTRAEMRAISRQLDQAKQRFDVGLIAVTDVHEVQAAYDQARANEISAINALDGTWEALREIVAGFDGKSINRLRSNIPLSRPNPDNVDTWTETALQRNPDIIASRNTTEVARKTIDLQRSGHLPALDLVAQAATENSDSRFGYGSDADMGTIGLQLSVPLYTGGEVSSRTRQARYDFQTSSDKLEQLRRQVKRQVSDAYRGVVSSISRVKALDSATRSAESALAATQAGFDVGTRTMVDVLTVQQNLYRARRDYEAAHYQYIIYGLQLKMSAGTLKVDDLQLINSLLKKG
jgi:outer membrane protein